MKEYYINNNVAYIEGAVNGAIYDFNSKNVYSLNENGCEKINLYLEKLDDSNEFLKKLESLGLISKNFIPTPITINNKPCIQLEMAWLEITEACNLRCIHCYEGCEHFSSKHLLTIERWKEIIDELCLLGVKRIVVIGGEPCCYKNINQILSYCGSKKIHTTLFTNCTLITGELAKTIIENKIEVKFSLYGHNAKIHDEITKIKGSFDETIKNVKFLLNNGVEVYPSIVIMKENELYVNDIINFVKSIGLPYKRYDVIRNVYGGDQQLHKPITKEIIDKAFYHKPKFSCDINFFEDSHFKNMCWFGKIAIQDNGNVIPCVFEREISYGDCTTDSIYDILKNENLKKYWYFNMNEIDECRLCEFRYCCKDCRPLGLCKRNNIRDKNARCLYSPKEGKWKSIE